MNSDHALEQTGPTLASAGTIVDRGARVRVDELIARLLRGQVWRANWKNALVILPVVLYVGTLILAPVAALVVGALSEGPGGLIAALLEPAMLEALRLTLLIGVIAVAVHSLGGLVLAYVLVRHRFPGKAVIDAAVDLPFALSPVVVGYMLFLLFGRNGVLAPALQALGLRVVFSLPGMILATLFVTLPFMVREIAPLLRALGPDQEEAAATMGASAWQTFRFVTLPSLRWGLIYGVTLTFARALGEFGAVLVVGGGIQGKTETATLYIYRALDERHYVDAYACALLLGMLSLSLVVGTEVMRRREN